MDTMCVESTKPVLQMHNKLLTLPNGEHMVLQGAQQHITLLKLLSHDHGSTYDCDGDLAMDLRVHDYYAQRGVPVDTAHVLPLSADVQKQKKLHQRVSSFEFEPTTITRRTARLRRSPCT